MRMCMNCGCQMPDNALVCSECGAKMIYGDKALSVQPMTEKIDDSLEKTTKLNLDAIKKAIKENEYVTDTAKKAEELRGAYVNMQKAAAEFSMCLAEGEVIIRQYDATKVFFPRVNGQLIVTNKRVLFYSGSIGSKMMSSLPIDSVGAISIFNGSTFKWAYVMMVALGLWMFFGGTSVRTSYTGTLILVGLILIAAGVYLGGHKSIYLSISSVNSAPGMVIGKPNTIGASFYAVEGVGGKDIDQLSNEIGAVVLDLQQMGDAAIEKWTAGE